MSSDEVTKIRRCSPRRGDIVLDPFAGSGSTLIAAQQTGRIAHLIEFAPLYCDTILRRFEALTGKQATLAASGQSVSPLEKAGGIPSKGIRGARSSLLPLPPSKAQVFAYMDA